VKLIIGLEETEISVNPVCCRSDPQKSDVLTSRLVPQASGYLWGEIWSQLNVYFLALNLSWWLANKKY